MINQKMSQKIEFQSPTFRDRIRLWLLDHPRLNPYRFSFDRTYRLLTNRFRMYPDFIIIGSIKSGGQSLMYYLRQHPSIEVQHDVNFFQYTYSNRLESYRAYFPTSFYKAYLKTFHNTDLVSGEMTSSYIFHPQIPERVKETIPNVKLIVNLRNPVDRAYSAYNHMVRDGWESKTFEDAINSELRRIEIIEEDGRLNSKNPHFENFHMFLYLRQGNYAEKLRTWMEFFPKEKFFIFSTNELAEKPTEVIGQVFDHLNVPNIKIKNFERRNVGKYNKMKESMRDFLVDYYKPYNKNLYELIGKKFDWDK